MKFFTKYFKYSNLKQFKIFSIGALWMGDLFTIFYLVTEVKKNNFVDNYIKAALKINGMNYDEFDPHMLEETRVIVMSTLSVFLLGIMLVNNVNYYFYYKNKKWATTYVRFLAYTSLFLTFIVLLQGITQFSFTQLLNVFSVPLYMYVILGLEHFKQIQNVELQIELPEDLPKPQ